MARHQCANPTCTATTVTTYCSRRCQLTMRNTGRPGYGQLPDIWLSMDTERLLVARAATRGVNVRDLVVELIEAEFDWRAGLDFGEGPIEAPERERVTA